MKHLFIILVTGILLYPLFLVSNGFPENVEPSKVKDSLDLFVLGFQWNTNQGNADEDFNKDGKVDRKDLIPFLRSRNP